MHCAYVGRLLILCLAIWMTGAPVLRAESSLRSRSNPYFEVVGFHLRSVTFVHDLSLFTAEIAERYLEREGIAFPRPILVSLRPEPHANFEGDYRIRIEQRGMVELDIRWEDSMTLEFTCRALCEALLTQYALYNHGHEAATMLRSWPVEALTQEVYLGLRPAEMVDLINGTRGQDVPALTVILESSLRTPPVAHSNAVDFNAAHWLLNLIKSEGIDRRILRSLFQQAVAGIDVEDALTSVIQSVEPTAEPVALETWWRAGMNSMLDRRYEAVETMEASRVWLASLAQFNSPLQLESEELRLNLRTVWTQRNRPEIREWMQARYDILRVRMARINPAYYNPAHSLGLLFEALLYNESPHQYLHALTIYLSDWEDAQDMQEIVEKRLGSK